jgi:molybdopterin molybdotransferase
MTAQHTLAPNPQLTPLADLLAGVLKKFAPLPPLELELAQAAGTVLADDVRALTALPAFDHCAVDGYAARSEDLTTVGSRAASGGRRTVRLDVAGDLYAASWRPVRVTAGSCYVVAAGTPLPEGADVVVPLAATDRGVDVVEIHEQPRRGHGVRRAGDEIRAGALLALAGTPLTPALLAVLAGSGAGAVSVRPAPRVAVIATGDELVDPGRPSQPGQVVDATSYALAAAAVEAGAQSYRVEICDDDPGKLRSVLDNQFGRADLVVTIGGTGNGSSDLVRRVLGGDGSVRFTDLSLYPCDRLGEGVLTGGPGRAGQLPVACLPGDPGAALIGFEVLVRPMVRKLAGADPVFRPSVKAHLLDTIDSLAGLREFRPATVSERRGGGYTAQPLAGGPYTLSGLAAANGLIVLGERVGSAAAGSTVDVLLLDRRR